MAKDTRQRNSRHLATTVETQVLDFAGPKQREAFAYGPAPIVLSGAFNSAKTVTFCLKMLKIADLYPGFRWFVGRRVWDELRKTTMASFFKFCPRQAWEPNGRRSDTEKILQLNNGSEFLWMHLDDPDTLSIVRGLEINGFMLDQAEELEEEVFRVLLSRLGRWDRVTVPQRLIEQYEMQNKADWPWVHEVTKKAIPPTYALLTCNPDHELHWIYETFHPESPSHNEKRIMVEREPRLLASGKYAQPGERVSYHDLGYKMIEVSAYDNKYATRQSLEQMESQDDSWKRRFLYGKWGIPEGQIHKVTDLSILEPTPAVLSYVMNSCTHHRSMDHGDSAATCVLWWGVDRDGNIFCVSPKTRILRDDLRWVYAEEIEVGDTVFGFDEQVPETGKRRWRSSLVLATEKLIQPRCLVKLSDGTHLTCSANHQWLVETAGTRKEWRQTKNLLTTDRLLRVLNVWDEDFSYGAGYLAGAFDGEGHLTRNIHGTTVTGLAQKDNALLARVRLELDEREIRYGVYEQSRPSYEPHIERGDWNAKEDGVYGLVITRKRDSLRMLGSVRPARLLPKLSLDNLGGFSAFDHPSVVSVDLLGDGEVIAIETSTGTYVAEGFASHNCFREYYKENALISEHRQNLHGLSKYERYGFELADPAIFAPSMQKHEQRWSVAQEYASCIDLPRETAINWTKGDNDEFGTRNRISEYLRPQGMWRVEMGTPVEVPRIHPLTKEKGLWPRLFFIKKTDEYPNGCDQAIRQLKSQRREKLGTENGKPIFSDDRDEKIPDHGYDPVRYFMASQPPLPTSVPRKYAANSFWGHRERAIRLKKKGFWKRMAREAKEQAEKMSA